MVGKLELDDECCMDGCMHACLCDVHVCVFFLYYTCMK